MEDAEKERLVQWAEETPPANVPEEYRERFVRIREKVILDNVSAATPQRAKLNWKDVTDEDCALLERLQKSLSKRPIEEVRTYLEESFPGKTVKHYKDRLSRRESFRIEEDGLSLQVTDEFLDEDTRTAEQIRQELARLPIANLMRDAGKAKRVVLTRTSDGRPLPLVEPLVRPHVIPPNQSR